MTGDPGSPTRRRWLMFVLVGGVGVVVQLGVLGWLLGAGANYLVATALGVEAAVLNNFWWHERWTWRDRTLHSPMAVFPRLVRFNLTVGAVSIAQNLLLMKVLVGYLAIHALAGNAISIGAASLANFFISDCLVFRGSSEPCLHN